MNIRSMRSLAAGYLSLLASILAMGVSVVFFVALVVFPLVNASLFLAALLVSIGLVGAAAGAANFWSAGRRRRWRLVGLGLSLLYLGGAVAPPVYVSVAKFHGPLALVLVTLAIGNSLSRERREGTR